MTLTPEKREALDLIEAVLKGYPSSIARNDALKTLTTLRDRLDVPAIGYLSAESNDCYSIKCRTPEQIARINALPDGAALFTARASRASRAEGANA